MPQNFLLFLPAFDDGFTVIFWWCKFDDENLASDCLRPWFVFHHQMAPGVWGRQSRQRSRCLHHHGRLRKVPSSGFLCLLRVRAKNRQYSMEKPYQNYEKNTRVNSKNLFSFLDTVIPHSRSEKVGHIAITVSFYILLHYLCDFDLYNIDIYYLFICSIHLLNYIRHIYLQFHHKVIYTVFNYII